METHSAIPLKVFRGKQTSDVKRMAFELANSMIVGSATGIETKEDSKNFQNFFGEMGQSLLMMVVTNKIANECKVHGKSLETSLKMVEVICADICSDLQTQVKEQISMSYSGELKEINIQYKKDN